VKEYLYEEVRISPTECNEDVLVVGGPVQHFLSHFQYRLIPTTPLIPAQPRRGYPCQSYKADANTNINPEPPGYNKNQRTTHSGPTLVY